MLTQKIFIVCKSNIVYVCFVDNSYRNHLRKPWFDCHLRLAVGGQGLGARRAGRGGCDILHRTRRPRAQREVVSRHHGPCQVQSPQHWGGRADHLTIVVTRNENRLMERFGVRHRLVINSVSQQDFANYSCLAENELGKSRGYVELSGGYRRLDMQCWLSHS